MTPLEKEEAYGKKYVNSGVALTAEQVETTFPGFYNSNEQLIKEGKVVVFEEPWGLECAVAVNLSDLTTEFFDYRN